MGKLFQDPFDLYEGQEIMCYFVSGRELWGTVIKSGDGYFVLRDKDGKRSFRIRKDSPEFIQLIKENK